MLRIIAEEAKYFFILIGFSMKTKKSPFGLYISKLRFISSTILNPEINLIYFAEESKSYFEIWKLKLKGW